METVIRRALTTERKTAVTKASGVMSVVVAVDTKNAAPGSTMDAPDAAHFPEEAFSLCQTISHYTQRVKS